MGRGPLGATPLDAGLPTTPFTTYFPGDFSAAFEPDQALDKIPIFNLLLTPGIWDPGVVSEALAVAERKRAFMVVDPPADAVADPAEAFISASAPLLPLIADVMTTSVPKSENGALYFPYLRSSDPSTGDPLTIAAVGIRRRGDRARGHQPRRLEGARRL